MANRVITRIENFLKNRNVQFERNYIAFRYDGKLFEVMLYNKEKRIYKVLITKGHKTSMQNFNVRDFDEMLQYIAREMEGYEDD